jgi:hypothetical protein
MKERDFYKGFYNLNMISLAIQEVFSHLAGEIHYTMSVKLLPEGQNQIAKNDNSDKKKVFYLFDFITQIESILFVPFFYQN